MYRSPESLWCDVGIWQPTPAECIGMWLLRVAVVVMLGLVVAGEVRRRIV
jgi:hypothetical protein